MTAKKLCTNLIIIVYVSNILSMFKRLQTLQPNGHVFIQTCVLLNVLVSAVACSRIVLIVISQSNRSLRVRMQMVILVVCGFKECPPVWICQANTLTPELLSSSVGSAEDNPRPQPQPEKAVSHWMCFQFNHNSRTIHLYANEYNICYTFSSSLTCHEDTINNNLDVTKYIRV